MLEELTVKNYALIENINIKFNDGLNILTGETGAGKSILIGALGLLLGSKSDVSFIRTGCDEAVISGIINVSSNEEASIWLDQHAIKPEEGVIIIRRVIKTTGRGSSFIQGSQVTRNDLITLTSFLFDMHGQHEHQSLLKIDQHRKLVDRYGGHESLVSLLYNDFIKLAELRKKHEEIKVSEAEQLREKEILQFSIEEIENAELKPGDEESLEQELTILANAEKLFSFLEDFNKIVSETQGGALSGLRISMGYLDNITEINPDFSTFGKRLNEAFYEIEDITDSVRQYKDSIDFSPGKLDECEEKLQNIHRLEKKYGHSITDVLEYAASAYIKLKKIETIDTEFSELKNEIEVLEKRVLDRAKELSHKRKMTAVQLEQNIEKQLFQLGMPKARFKVETGYRESDNGKSVCGPYGFDKIEFLISPNEGEPLKKLRAIASGGEISRVMLAIKTILSETDHIQSLIFDEIDSGIGGAVAVSVGEHLKKISVFKQILCITHLAQVAVCADNHIVISKEIVKNRTFTILSEVSGTEKTKEIARMLSGDSEGKVSMVHAEQMLKRYI